MLKSDPPLANEADLEIPVCVADADAAVALIREHMRKRDRRRTKRADRA
jgi:hypothetical protein